MKTPLLSRRTVLRGAGGVALALPWLEAMGLPGERMARAATLNGFPKRFMVFFTPNGTIQENLIPGGGPTSLDLSMSQILSPLQPYQDYVNVILGLNVEAANHGPGDGHQTGMGCMLTGIELLPGTVKGGCDTCAAAGYPGGPSVDQVIVQKAMQKTKFPSLELGIQSGSRGTVWGYSNYSAANMPLPLENSPHNAFQRVFSDFTAAPADPNALNKLKAERKSLLDAVAQHYQMLSAKVGKVDKQRLDAHAAAVRDLEQRLLNSAATSSSMACAKPTDPGAPTDPQMIGRLQADLLITAMACDLTRVGTIQWENSVGGMKFTWLGATRGHHDMSHDGDGIVDTKAMLTKINNWLAGELAYIVKRLKSIPEGNGTMLDNTLILWCNELARGNSHSRNNETFVTVGKAGGAVKAGRLLKFTKTSNNNLLVSILNAFDVQATTFGNPAYCTGPLMGF